MDLHAALNLRHAVFHRHHLLPVIACIVHYALDRLLRRINDFGFTIFDDGYRNRSFNNNHRTVADFICTGPVLVIRIERNIKIAEHSLETGSIRRNDLFSFFIVNGNDLRFVSVSESESCQSHICLTESSNQKERTCYCSFCLNECWSFHKSISYGVNSIIGRLLVKLQTVDNIISCVLYIFYLILLWNYHQIKMYLFSLVFYIKFYVLSVFTKCFSII